MRVGDQAGDVIVGNGTEQAQLVAAFELRSQRAVAGECKRPCADPLESPGQPDNVLSLGQRPEAQIGTRSVGRGGRPEPVEVDAAVHDLGLAPRSRDLALELPAQIVGDGDHGAGAANDGGRRSTDAGALAAVGDVLTVRRDDERRPRRERRDQPGRHEEVGIDDIGPEPPSGLDRAPGQARVLAPAGAATGQDGRLDLVPAPGERQLQLPDEDAVIGLGVPRIHLRDEQDPHRGAVSRFWCSCVCHAPAFRR